MSALNTETILSVHHWNDTLFSFRTTRDQALRFVNGQFVTIGLEVEGRPRMRAYSIASANYEEHLEFFSIKVPNGPLTSPSISPRSQSKRSRRSTMLCVFATCRLTGASGCWRMYSAMTSVAR